MSTTTVANHEEHHDHPTGIMRWLTTTNHKDIGTMYLTFSLIMFLVGGSMILGIRAELFKPGLQLMNPDFFNQLIGHAVTKLFIYIGQIAQLHQRQHAFYKAFAFQGY